MYRNISSLLSATEYTKPLVTYDAIHLAKMQRPEALGDTILRFVTRTESTSF